MERKDTRKKEIKGEKRKVGRRDRDNMNRKKGEKGSKEGKDEEKERTAHREKEIGVGRERDCCKAHCVLREV
jgi:hypothetical protein